MKKHDKLNIIPTPASDACVLHRVTMGKAAKPADEVQQSQTLHTQKGAFW